MVVQLKVNTPRGNEVIMDVCKTQTLMDRIKVEDLKQTIIKQLRIEGEIRVVYQSQDLDDSHTLGHYQIRHMSTIQAVLILPGGGH